MLLITVSLASLSIHLSTARAQQFTPEQTMVMEESMMRSSLGSILMTIKQNPGLWVGILDKEDNPLRSMELTDEANLLIRDFAKSCNKPQTAETEKEQQNILARFDKATLLAKSAEAKKAAAEKAKAQAANPAPQTPAPVAAAPTNPLLPQKAAKPLNPDAPEPIEFSAMELIKEPEVLTSGKYAMPAKLTTEEARDLIVRTDALPKKLDKLMELSDEYSNQMQVVLTAEVQARFWNRIVNKEGFKDPTIARDWSNFAIDNKGFVALFQALAQKMQEAGANVFARIKIVSVQINIIGSRITWGDQAFINGADSYVTYNIRKMEADIAFLKNLIERCKVEGTVR